MRNTSALKTRFVMLTGLAVLIPMSLFDVSIGNARDVAKGIFPAQVYSTSAVNEGEKDGVVSRISTTPCTGPGEPYYLVMRDGKVCRGTTVTCSQGADTCTSYDVVCTKAGEADVPMQYTVCTNRAQNPGSGPSQVTPDSGRPPSLAPAEVVNPLEIK